MSLSYWNYFGCCLIMYRSVSAASPIKLYKIRTGLLLIRKWEKWNKITRFFSYILYIRIRMRLTWRHKNRNKNEKWYSGTVFSFDVLPKVHGSEVAKPNCFYNASAWFFMTPYIFSQLASLLHVSICNYSRQGCPGMCMCFIICLICYLYGIVHIFYLECQHLSRSQHCRCIHFAHLVEGTHKNVVKITGDSETTHCLKLLCDSVDKIAIAMIYK